MVFEGEQFDPLQNPSPEVIEAALNQLHPRGPSFFTLTSGTGSYVQVAGAKGRLIVEFRDVGGSSFQHFVLGREPVNSERVSINYSGGAIQLLRSEVLALSDALQIFSEFLSAGSIPPSYALRDNTRMFTLP